MSRDKRAAHEYTSFFNPWTETSALHMNISCSLIHELKQVSYTWIQSHFIGTNRTIGTNGWLESHRTPPNP